MADSKFSLVIHDPRTNTRKTFHMAPAPEEVTLEEKHLLTLVPLPGLDVFYKESHGHDIRTVSWRGTFGIKQRKLADGTTKTGLDLFFAFKKAVWDQYLVNASSKDPRIRKGARIEYHDYTQDLHYYAEPVRFLTPRGRDNKTFFKYDIAFQLHAPIKQAIDLPVKDAKAIARQTNNALKRFLEKIKAVGSWIADKAEKLQNLVNRYVIQPVTQLVGALDSFLSGVTAVISLPLKITAQIIDGIALVVEQVGTLTNDIVTTGINDLRNIRRATMRVAAAGELFKANMDIAADDYRRFMIEEEDDGDSDVTLEDKRAGENQRRMAYANQVTEDSYEGARRVTVRADDTLQRMAATYLGDASKWRHIAILNGYEGNGDLASGTDILIPVIPGNEGSGISGDLGNDRYATNPALMEERLYGRDLAVVPDGNGYLDIHWGEDDDLATVAGSDNLIQAVRLKTRIPQGELLENPEYGLRRLVGKRGHPFELPALVHGLKVAAESDPRIAEADVKVEQTGNVVDANYTLYPVGAVGRRPVDAVVERI